MSTISKYAYVINIYLFAVIKALICTLNHAKNDECTTNLIFLIYK